ncbi:hypothetical protein [Nocardia fusca]|uniref:hypothetical protein n=1 Tax=Nocardia fusca TaxID=941183 RepID=UPI0012F4AEAD|nr:hypothetical protein [Nocardia fusca]
MMGLFELPHPLLGVASELLTLAPQVCFAPELEGWPARWFGWLGTTVGNGSPVRADALT